MRNGRGAAQPGWGMWRSRQILLARMSLISLCRGTAVRLPLAGLPHQECFAPSKMSVQPCAFRWAIRSRRFNLDDLLLVGLPRKGQGVAAVHFQSLAKRRAKVFQECRARLSLAIHAWNLDDPADPERPILLYDRCKLLAHARIIPRTSRLGGSISTGNRHSFERPITNFADGTCRCREPRYSG